MKQFKALMVLALGLVLTVPAFAETQNVKVSGSLDIYSFYRSDFDLRRNNDAGVVPQGTAVPAGGGAAGSAINRSDADQYFRTDTQIQVAADLTDNVSTVINLVNQRDWNAVAFNAPAAGNLAGTTGTRNTDTAFDIELDLAYVQMKEVFFSPLTLTLGRQDLSFGRGFILGWNPQDNHFSIQADEFTAVQSFDALRATLDLSPWTIDAVYAKVGEDSLNAEDDLNLMFLNANYKFDKHNAVAEVYYMGEYDRRTLAGAAGTDDNDTHTYGGRFQLDPLTQMTFGAEWAFQFGQYRPALSSPQRDREAWATDIFAEYRFDHSWKPMAGVAYVLLSGEEDLSVNSSQSYGAWNDAFRGPTYGWIHEYLETYYATAQANDQATGQNMEHIDIYGSIQPLDDVLLSGHLYFIWAEADIFTTVGDKNSGVKSADLGQELDLQATYNYTEDVTLDLMAHWFFPGNFYDSPNDSTATQLVSKVKVTF